jgi:Flp pilus assembly protein TadG
MILCSRKNRRCGVNLVETAIVLPITFFLLMGLVIGATGIFRYQEVAHLAREGARYASTHGGRYQADGIATSTGVPAISASTDLQTYLSGETVMLDPSLLQVTVTWTGAGSVTPANSPTYADPNSSPPGENVIQNYVIVTVSYQWLPELYLVGPITLTSTSEMPMSY